MTIKAIYEDGVFKPQEPVHLDEHTEVEVSITTEVPLDAADLTGWKAAEALTDERLITVPGVITA